MFTKELIQAISDWQRGGSARQKAKRGDKLRQLASQLPTEYRTVHLCCFRQIALTGGFLRHMGTHFELAESLSSWTKSEQVAREFKGGVPAKGQGYQGVIFALAPPPDSVILDLSALFANSDFLKAVNEFQASITGFSAGIGRYLGAQQEVILDLPTVSLKALYAWGGYSSDEDTLARLFFGYSPRQHELEWFRYLLASGSIRPGAYWLTTPEAVDRINERLKFHAARLTT